MVLTSGLSRGLSLTLHSYKGQWEYLGEILDDSDEGTITSRNNK